MAPNITGKLQKNLCNLREEKRDGPGTVNVDPVVGIK